MDLATSIIRHKHPGPRGLGLIADRWIYIKDQLRWLEINAKRYGDIVRLSKKNYLFNHPDLVDFILSSTNQRFTNSNYEFLGEIGRFWGNSVPISQGDNWATHRRLIQPVYHRQHFEYYSQVIVANALQMLEGWKNGEQRNLQQELMKLTLKSAVQIILGETGEIERKVQETLLAVMYLLDNPYHLSVSFSTPEKTHFHQRLSDLNEMIYTVIKARRSGHQNGHDMVSMLINAKDKQGYQMSDEQIRDEIAAMLRASYKNTATSLSWVWYLLAQHPAVNEQLFSEIQAFGDSLSFDDLPRLSYTNYVLKEALRLYPLYPVLLRAAVEDFEVHGYTLKAGTQVIVSSWLLHRDQRYFDAPTEFRPERWANNLEMELPRYTYFPFGGGTRICNAKGYVMLEAALLLATIGKQFRFTLVDDKPVQYELSPNGLRPKNGLNMILWQR